MSVPAIEVKGLAKTFRVHERPPGLAAALRSVFRRTYKNVDAVKGLSFRVEAGERVGFLGPNGAGKTTAVKLLLGLTRPTRGRATVLGAPLGDRATRGRIGYLPELFRYQPWLHAREVLELHTRLIGGGVDRSRRAIDRILEEVGLADRADESDETSERHE